MTDRVGLASVTTAIQFNSDRVCGGSRALTSWEVSRVDEDTKRRWEFGIWEGTLLTTNVYVVLQ